MGLKGIIPSLLHHTLLGYNFLIPDAVGNTTAYEYIFSPQYIICPKRASLFHYFIKKKTQNSSGCSCFGHKLG